MTNPNNAAQAAEKEIDTIMEQAQVFASAWAFFGGPLDQGDGQEQAEREKANLRAPVADERADDAAALLGKYKKLCVEIGRGDSHHLGRIDAAITALASAPVAGEAAGEIVLFGGELKEVSWRDGKMPPAGTKLYAAPQPSTVAGEAQEHYDEVKSTLQGAHRIMESLSAIERRVGPVGSHARGYTHKITNALRHLDALYAAPQASAEDVRNAALEEAAAFLEANRTHWLSVRAAYEIRYLKRTQADKAAPVCSCPHQGDGSLRWPCAVHPPPHRDAQPNTDGIANG